MSFESPEQYMFLICLKKECGSNLMVYFLVSKYSYFASYRSCHHWLYSIWFRIFKNLVSEENRLNYKTGALDTDVLKEYIDHKCPSETHTQPNRIEIVCGVHNIENEHIDGDSPEFLCDIPDPINLGQIKHCSNIILSGFVMVVIFHYQNMCTFLFMTS